MQQQVYSADFALTSNCHRLQTQTSVQLHHNKEKWIKSQWGSYLCEESQQQQECRCCLLNPSPPVIVFIGCLYDNRAGCGHASTAHRQRRNIAAEEGAPVYRGNGKDRGALGNNTGCAINPGKGQLLTVVQWCGAASLVVCLTGWLDTDEQGPLGPLFSGLHSQRSVWKRMTEKDFKVCAQNCFHD